MVEFVVILDFWIQVRVSVNFKVRISIDPYVEHILTDELILL